VADNSHPMLQQKSTFQSGGGVTPSKSFTLHNFYLGLNLFVFRAAKFVVQILSARWLSVSDFGFLSWIYTLVDILNNLLGAGVDIVVSRAYKQQADWVALWQQAIALRLVLGLIGTVVGLLILPWPYGIFLGAWHIFYLQGRLFYAYANTLLYPKGIVLSGVLSEGALLVGSVVGLRFFGLEGLIAAFVLERLVESLSLGAIVAQRESELLKDFNLSGFPERSGKVFKNSSRLWANQALGILASRVDTVLIKRILGLESVGFYSLAFRTAEAPVFIFAAMGDAALAYFIRHQDEKEKNYKKSIQVASATGLLGALAIVGCSFFVDKVFGANYAMVKPLLASYAWILALRGPNMVSSSYLISNGRDTSLLVSSALGVVFSLAGNLAFLPIFGIKAACFLSVATEGVIFVSRHALAKKGWGWPALFSGALVCLSVLSYLVLSRS